jgi:hypothetical protein
MALVVWYVAAFCGEFGGYYSAYTYYQTRPQGEWNTSAHLSATTFALHDGTQAGSDVGIIAYIVMFLATSRKWGWWSIPFAIAGSMVAGAAAGYIAGFSP